jgi:hypothetical protein
LYRLTNCVLGLLEAICSDEAASLDETELS